MAVGDGLTVAAPRAYRGAREPERWEVMTAGFVATTLIALALAAGMIVPATEANRRRR